MTTAALGSIGGKLAGELFSYLQTQAKYATEFKVQLESMKTQLDLMMAFLTDSESLKNRNETLKTTLKKMRDLVYEADDILTDCLVRDEYWQVDNCCAEYYPSQLKFKYETGYKLKEINSKIDQLERALGNYLRPQEQGVQRGYWHQITRFTSQEFDPSEIIGLETDAEKIKNWIFRTDGVLHRIGVVGMGGLGKTTIAQKVFNDPELAGYFDHRIWVSVSQDSNDERIMRSILDQLDYESSSITDQGQMLRKIHQLLKDKSCLIVVDDVWQNLDWWPMLCSALSKRAGKSSCAIITTRLENVAISMGVDSSRIHWPKVLNKEESWKLFCMCAFSGNKGKWPNEQFKSLGQEIVEKCGGLPLAIKTVGGLLAPKLHSYKEWQKVQQDFHKLTTSGEVNSVAASLQLSYDALPPHLKQCLLCFAIYPEDVEIRAEQLVHWWAGEGLIPSIETGYKHLQELVSRCLIEAVQRRGYDGRVYMCKMHDLVRDLMMKISDEETLCSFDGKGKQILTHDSRWLGYKTGMNIDSRLVKSSPRLRAFLLMPGTTIPSEKIFQGRLSSLRVLDFSQAKLDTRNISIEDLFTWICSLKRLACLNLSGLQSLKELPSSIEKLKNLQFLILTGCSNLTKVSPSVIFLKRLLVLGLGSCRIEFLPKGLDQLTHLQELSGFRVVRQANTNSFRLLELQKLSKLNVLRMNISSESEIADDEWDVLSKLEHLSVLSIDTENSQDRRIVEILNKLSPPPSLQELYLRRYRHETLPEWVNPKKLSMLQYLCIEDGDVGSIRVDDKQEESHSTWSLEGLCLKFLPNLMEDWKDLEKDMPLLEYVEVSHCFNLQNFPCSVRKPGVWRKKED